MGLIDKLRRIWRHRWIDELDTGRAVPSDLLERLRRRVAASEQRHSGEIRLCVEAGLPMSYLWRNAAVRERAVMMFSKLRVWDTEQNNGVLIYLLLADHAIEFVADRGINAKVPPQAWQAMVQHLGAKLRLGQYEEGLTQALEEVSAVLVQHFPVAAHGASNSRPPNPNELDDRPFVQ